VNVSKVSIAVALAVSVFALSACSGPAGTAGAPGAAGAKGAVGQAGAAGAVGATGPAGATGATGSQGSTGATGAKGSVGATGATGSKGSTGSTGAAGAVGATGLTGAMGSAGAAGPAGPAGAAGAVGAAGAAGRDGTDGVSGYAYVYNVGAESVGPGSNVTFSNNGDMSSQFAHTPGNAGITISSSGLYSVWFSVAGPGDLAIELNGLPVQGGIYGSGSGSQQNSGMAVVNVSAGDTLTIASSGALTLQEFAGAFGIDTSASVMIEKVG
jgi:hypothetical protein